MHNLIVFPFYFFLALTLTALFSMFVRVLRIRVAIGTVVTIAVLSAMAAMVLILRSDAVSVDDLGAAPMLALAGASFVLAAIDRALKGILPHAIDDEMADAH